MAAPGEQDNRQYAFKGQQNTNFNAATSAVCCFCEGKHALLDCFKFKSQPHNEKVECLKINGYCFGCLKKGHMSKDCKTKLDYQTCQRKHPTLLHIDTRTSDKQPLQNRNSPAPKQTSINSVQVSADDASGAGKECALAIVPVQVKAAKGSKCIQTYAFLDPGSSATFCTEKLMNQLNVTGRKKLTFCCGRWDRKTM